MYAVSTAIAFAQNRRINYCRNHFDRNGLSRSGIPQHEQLVPIVRRSRSQAVSTFSGSPLVGVSVARLASVIRIGPAAARLGIAMGMFEHRTTDFSECWIVMD